MTRSWMRSHAKAMPRPTRNTSLWFVRRPGGCLSPNRTAESSPTAAWSTSKGCAMLCDLFVAADARGMGVGTQLLGELFDGSSGRMTFSSKHAAAHAAYRRAGMEPRWRLLCTFAVLPSAVDHSGQLVSGGTDRAALVEQMARQGAHVSTDVVSMPEGNGVWIARLQSARPVEALAAAVAG